MTRAATASRLTLIGTLHGDPRGEEGLLALLEQLEPGALTVEVCPELVVYRQQTGILLQRKLEMILDRLAVHIATPRTSLTTHPSILAIQEIFDLPFEFRAAKRYAQHHHIPLNCIDCSAISMDKLLKVEHELISFRHLKRIVTHPQPASPPKVQNPELARQLLSAAPPWQRKAFLDSCRGAEGIGPRDLHLEERIRQLHAAHSGVLVHIGGWVHLVDDPQGETLYSRLADLSPQRILLDPAPHLPG